jgi:hypothetical protein
MKAKGRVAIDLPSLAIQVFKMQFDYSRIVEVGRKVVRGVGSHSAHVKDGVSYLRRETIDMLRVPWLIVRRPATARKSA